MEHSTSFSRYRSLQGASAQQLRAQLPPMTVGGQRFDAFQVDSGADQASIRYRRGGSQDEIAITVSRSGNDSGRIYGTGQIGQVSFGRDVPGFPLSANGFAELEGALDRDYTTREARANCTGIRILPNASDLGICLAESGVEVTPERASLPLAFGKATGTRIAAKD